MSYLAAKTKKIFIEKKLDKEITVKYVEGEVVAFKGFLWRITKVRPKDIHLKRLTPAQVAMVKKEIENDSRGKENS